MDDKRLDAISIALITVGQELVRQCAEISRLRAAVNVLYLYVAKREFPDNPEDALRELRFAESVAMESDEFLKECQRIVGELQAVATSLKQGAKAGASLIFAIGVDVTARPPVRQIA